MLLIGALAVVLAPAPGAAQLVERVVDGDTIIVQGVGRVRLIGVDTPETVHPRRPVECFGKEASAFTKRLLEGRRARLEYDRERTDRYGRTLAYVYLPNGTFANAEIVRQGYGHAYTRFPFRYLDEFRQHEREARRRERGLWGAKCEDAGAGARGKPTVRHEAVRRIWRARALRRQRQRPYLLRRGAAPRHCPGAAGTRRVPLHARRRRRRRSLRVTLASRAACREDPRPDSPVPASPPQKHCHRYR